MLSRIHIVAAFSAGLTACAGRPGSYDASVHQLRINPAKYEGERVVVKGVLGGFPYGRGPVPFLYATRDDAQMNNLSAGVGLDLYTEEVARQIGQCMSGYVQVIGRLQAMTRHDGKGISEIELIARLESGQDQCIE